MKLGRLTVSYEVLRQALALPAGTRILRVSDHNGPISRDTFEIRVANDSDLPEVGDGEEIPEVQFIATQTVGHFYQD